MAEVRRWFRRHDTIGITELLALVGNVSMLGPTGAARYPKPLLQRGVIDYADKFARERAERLQRALEESTELQHSDLFEMTGFTGSEKFVWTWDEQQESNGENVLQDKT